MPPFTLHQRPALRALTATAALAWLGTGCADGALGAKNSANPAGDFFGGGAQPFPEDAGPALDGGSAGSQGIADGSRVRVRLVHGIVNAGELYLCHRSDLPAADAGHLPAVELPVHASFGGVSEYVSLRPLNGGALTLHRRQTVAVDGGVAEDSGIADAGATDDAGLPEMPCSDQSLLAVLPLGPRGMAGDAGVDDDAGTAFVSFEAGDTATVFASGLLLEEGHVAARVATVRSAYLAQHPGDIAGADSAAQAAGESYRTAIGPQLTAAQDDPARTESAFHVAIAHLVPDVPSVTAATGGVRVCVTADTLEKAVEPPVDAAPIGFRESVRLAPTYATDVNYQFRVFASDAFTTSAGDCATTGLKPIAAIDVPRKQFQGGRTYTLALLGAIEPGPLCAPVDAASLIAGGCALTADQLLVRLAILPQ